MDVLPPVLEIGCAVNGRKEPIAPENGGPCLSSFPWVSAVWGAAGAVVVVVLAAALLWQRCRHLAAMQKMPKAASGASLSSLALESPAGSLSGPFAIPLPPRLQSSGGPSSVSSYSRGGSSGLGRRPVLLLSRSALVSRGACMGMQQASPPPPAAVQSVSPSLLAAARRWLGAGGEGEGEEQERPQTR